jgi:hypothetical protein
MKYRSFIQLAAAIVAGASVCHQASAENIIFPRVKAGISDASGIVDVTLTPYFADKTGKTDATAALQKAFDEHQLLVTIYMPNGTYLVSNTLVMSSPCTPTGGCNPGPILQGQSQAGTVIKLAPGKFTSAGSPKPVLTSGDGVAQEFQRGIHNLTVRIGANNAGANGIRWFSNNQALMSDVTIVSEDGSANIGVDLAGGEQGPCGMRDITIKGFSIGIASNALNSVTCWNLTIENSRQYGISNPNGPLYIENLVCTSAPVAVRNQGAMTLLNAQCNGGTAAKSAVENTGLLYARNIKAQGYGKALTTGGAAAPAGLTIDEYASKQTSQFPSPTRSIGLPYKKMPDVAWEQDTTKWGNVWVAKGGLGTTPKSDIAALQGLIDNPAITSIILPAGRSYQIDSDVFIRGNIKRLVGTGGRFIGTGRLVITGDGTQPVIKLERIQGIPIVNQSNKTVIIESYLQAIYSTGTGDFFMSDVVANPVVINSATQRVWAWQFNAEASEPIPKLAVQNAYAMRIVGWKDEPTGQSIDVQKGIVELLGFMFYASWSTAGQTMFVVQDGAQFAAACVTQISFSGNEFSNLVRETRAGVAKTLTSSANGGADMPLYTGYEAAKIPSDVLPAVQASRKPDSRTDLKIASGIDGRLTISWPGRLRATCVDLYAASGARVAAVVPRGPACEVPGLPVGIYQVIVSGGGFRTARSIVVTR